MKRGIILLAALAVWLGAARRAEALPRFAVRTGLPCSACHVNPTGGGMRTPFGRNVYAQRWLATPNVAETTWAPPELEVGEHVTFGGDLRAGYLWQNSARDEFADVSSFNLMQGDLYVAVDAGPKLSFYLDRGVYGGYEAFVLVRPWAGKLALKVGRFFVPFGLRDVNHAHYVREGVGFGATDKDSGVEVGWLGKRTSIIGSITNGTYGDAFLDTGGANETNVYDKMVSLRLVHQPRLGRFQLLVSASAAYNENVSQQNPLFVPALFIGRQSEQIRQGVDEWRADLAAGVSIGRLWWRGEIVGIRDSFEGPDLRALYGYSSFQELGLTPIQGLDLVVTYEFADSDVEFSRGRVERVGADIAWFPLPYLEISVIARHQWGEADFLIGARDDVIVFTHLYL